MNDVKYIVINIICFLMMSCSAVVFGSDQDRTISDTYAQILNTDDAQQAIQRIISSAPSSSVAARFFAQDIADRLAQASRAEMLERSSTRVIGMNQLSQQGRDTLRLEMQVGASERRQSAPLAERIKNLNIIFDDQVGGMQLSEEHKARRARERHAMQIDGRWTE